MKANKDRMRKYINIEEVPNTPGHKTKLWKIQNIKTDFVVGVVKWHGAWRKYCFFPVADTLFDSDCLILIAEFVKDQNTVRTL